MRVTDEDEAEREEIAQTERIGLGDAVIAALLAIGTLVLQFLWEFPGVPPAAWNDVTVAFGIRPAVHVTGGYWMAFAGAVNAFFGLVRGLDVLRILGHVALAVLAASIYILFREMLAFIMRMRPQFSRRRTFVTQFSAAVGAIAFVCADRVWSAGQFLGEEMVLFTLVVVSLECFFAFLRKGSIGYAYAAAVLLGLLAAEAPAGFLLPIVLVSVNAFLITRFPILESPFYDPAVLEVCKWNITFLYLGAMLVGAIFNCWMFIVGHGLGAVGETVGALPLLYLSDYWASITGAADLTAWLMWIGLCLTPFLVTAFRFPSASDEAQFLPYSTGLVFVFCGLLAVAQSGFLPALWFWSYFPVDSAFFLMVGNFLSAITLAAAVTILGVDALCRNHERLSQQLFGLNDNDADFLTEIQATPVHSAFPSGRMVFVALVIALIVALMLPGRVQRTTREMLSILRDTVRETVREAKGAAYLFTDGNLDAALELEGAMRGEKLTCLSLMGGAGAYDGYLRLRGISAAEDRFSFGFDAGMGLRTWIRDRPDRLKTAAVQMGFDLWKRDGHALPPMGGLLSRPTGFPDEAERQRGIAEAHRLIERVFAVYAHRGGVTMCADRAIRDAFNAVQWRLARMCAYRADAADLGGNAEYAIGEVDLAQRLNDRNEKFQEVVVSVQKRNEQLLQKMTPREGLQLALVRADFTMARVYAEAILGSDPENADANFAMGMFYGNQRQYARAEEYLKRCLIRRPREAAVYNNLAMLQTALGKFAAAHVNVEKALRLLPDSAAVRHTAKALDEAEAAKRGKVPPPTKP